MGILAKAATHNRCAQDSFTQWNLNLIGDNRCIRVVTYIYKARCMKYITARV